jgi:molecular chaperone GrpE
MVPDELPQGTPGPDDFEALKKQLEDEQKKSAENLAGWQRAAADFANYRKRAEQEKNDLVKFGNAALILKVLPVLDDFERAVATLPNGKLAELTWVEGVLLIQRKLQAILEAEGLKPMAVVGEDFDPTKHEAVLQEEVTDPALDGKVLAELQKGYTLHDKVIRPALVKVGRKSA